MTSASHPLDLPPPAGPPLAYDPYAGAPPQEEGGSAGLGDIVRVLKQRKWTIIITFFVVFAMAIGGTFAVLRYAPLWPSEAIIELRPPKTEITIGASPMRPDEMKQEIETEARKIRQLSVLQEVLSQPEVKATKFYQWYQGDFGECLDDLYELLGVAPIPESNLIRVRLATKYKDESRLIVRTVVDRYLARYRSSSKDNIFTEVDALKKTLAEKEAELKRIQDEKMRFREQADVPTLRSDRSATADLIGKLQEQLSGLEAAAAGYETQLRSLQGVDPGQIPMTPEEELIIENDPIVRLYRSQVESIEIETAAARRAGLGENHRQIGTLGVRRQGYYEKEIARREELTGRLRARRIESLNQELAQIRNQQARLQDQLEEYEAQRRDLERNMELYITMGKTEEGLTKQIDDLKGRLNQGTFLSDLNNRLNVVQYPEEAQKPSRPDYFLYLGGGFVISLLAGLGFAFLREFTDSTVRTPLDIAKNVHLSVLGAIPLLDDEEANVDEIEVATRAAPHSLVAEAFRQVRTNLLFSGPVESQRVLLITSPGPEDGKTAVAINLAVTFASGNQRVLLIDTNFRRPSVHKHFQNTRSDGLSNILIGQATLDQLVTTTELPGLDVLAAGPLPPNPVELLGSQYMLDLLNLARERYDRIVLDGPPVLLMSDSLVMSSLVDGVVVVARAVANSKGALKRTRDQLLRVNARIVGAVLNGAEARPGGYFRKQYRDFYEYTSDETIPQELPWPGEQTASSNEPPADAGQDEHEAWPPKD